jgi:predicted transcriptional regulator
MEIDEALAIAAERAGWSPTKIAATVGKSEASARAWLKGAAEMGASDYQTLRQELPGFADLVDGKAVA